MLKMIYFKKMYDKFTNMKIISFILTNDENIGNHGYIGTSILWIYLIYRRHIDIYFDTKYW